MEPQQSNSQRPAVEREFRFAVVMYGGISLAIYINGVAQELYKIVRATAKQRKADGSFGGYIIENPKGTEAVYRELAELLNARFVIDILSGTSAGGINAIFLAKGLANDQPLSQLENLWIDEGDIELLINDRQSVKNIDALQFNPRPTSLLNSQRMYLKLLEAFDKMDEEASTSGRDRAALVDELDLFVTATDIRGLSLPIRLADGEVHEYRYRTVFRFYHATDAAEREPRDDFDKENNPFLAFAARSTSSFPFAFEPIKIEDVETILGRRPFVRNYDYVELRKKWNRFHRDYPEKEDNFESHAFGDGGYLDNKPFSYITETLMRRRADTPVDRRLFYIEPAPERPTQSPKDQSGRPNPFENVAAALINLPRYETIREDLLKIQERNTLIERMNNILLQIERSRGNPSALEPWMGSGSEWARQYLDKLLDKFGFGYAAYHQLRVADTLDAFTGIIARNVGLEEEGEPYQMLRELVEAWRHKKYSSRSKDQNIISENDLLFRLDMRWRVRRLYFIMRLIDNLLLGIKIFRTDLPNTELSAEDKEHGFQAIELIKNSDGRWEIPDGNTEQQYVDALSWIKRQFNQAFVKSRVRMRKLRALAEEDGELRAYKEAFKPVLAMKDRVTEILHDDTELTTACEVIEKLSLTLASRSAHADEIPTGYLADTMGSTSAKCKDAMTIRDPSGRTASPDQEAPHVPDNVKENIKKCLMFYYDRFEYFDMLTFPITYATPIGESARMGMYRISPEDAKGLYREGTRNRSKLAGTKLGNFGAFFKREWRQNDILWGKLDGAERIITTLLPDSEKRNELLLRAWLLILKESLFGENRQNLSDHLGNDLWEEFKKTEQLPPGDLNVLIEKLRSFFQENPLVDFEFSRDVTLKSLGRSAQVVGSVLDGLVEQYPGLQTPALWLARIGQIVMGLLQVALPGSLPGAFLRHWIRIAYLFECFLILAGTIFDATGAIAGFGMRTLLVTLGLDLAVRFTAGFIKGSAWPFRLLRALVSIVTLVVGISVLILAFFGAIHIHLVEISPFLNDLIQRIKPAP